ncbi:MAG: hypothetical protein WAV51_04705 [Microgenomates group bacterium]
MSERSQQPLPEIVSKWVAAIADAEPKKIEKVKPEYLKEKIQKLAERKHTPIESDETYIQQEQLKAKQLTEIVNVNQGNVSMAMKELNETLRYKNLSSFETMHKRCETAWNLAKDKPDWLGSTFTPAEIENSAAAAKFVEKVSLLPEDLAKDPNVLFHLTSELSASMSDNVKARAEEINLVNKAILHIRDLKETNKNVAFPLNDEDLTYSLRGFRLYDEMLDGGGMSSDLHGFLQEYQERIDFRGDITLDQEIRYLEDIAKEMTKGDGVKIDDEGKRKFFKVKKEELKKYIDRTNRRVKELQNDKNLSQERRDVVWSQLSKEQQQKITQHPDSEPLNLYGFNPREQELLLSGDLEKIKEFFSDFIADIYGVGREQKHPELPDQTKYDRFKTALEWIFGEKAKVIKVPFEMAWSDRGKQEYTLKALAYIPGDIKDKLLAYRKLLGADLDSYANYNEYSSLAIGFMNEATPMLLGDKQGVYNERLQFILSNVDLQTIPEWLQERLLIKKNEVLNFDELYCRYMEATIAGKLEGNQIINLALGQKAELDAFKTKMNSTVKDGIDTVGFGVGLYDDDVLVYSEARISWIEATHHLEELKSIPLDKLTPNQLQELERLPDFIAKKAEQQTRLKERDRLEDPTKMSTVERYQEFSPLEARVFDMMEEYLSVQKNMSEDDLAKIHWKLRDAIWAARLHTIGSGYMVDRGAFMVTRPRNVELKSYKYTDNQSGKYVMVSPFMEDIQRIINPELFAYRFKTGGAMGERVLSMLRTSQYPEGTKLTTTKDWFSAWEGEENPEALRLRRFMEVAEQDMGISFSEMLGSGFMRTGADFDATAWRLDEGLLTQIQHAMIESKLSPEAWENAALGLQLLIAPNATARQRILEKMVDRMPLTYIEVMAGKRMNEVFARHGLSVKDQRLFQELLAKGQTKLWHDKKYLERTINLSKVDDFNEVIAPFMDKLGPVTAGKKELFRAVLLDVQAEAKKVIPQWSKSKFPISLALSGIDWSDSNFAKLGTAALDRRGRDMMNMAQARDTMLQIITDADLLGPEKFDDLVKKLKEYKSAINNYSTRDGAEQATYSLLKVICLFNENRGTRFLNPIGWIPGMTSLLKNIGEVEIDHLQPFHLLGEIGKKKRGGVNALEKWADKNKLFGRKIKDVPLSLSELVSLSVRFQGPEGNAWDEFKMAAFLNKIQRAGLFDNSPHLLNKLRRETHSTMPWRVLYGLPRKYWWVIPVATVTLATMESINDEKKKK